MADELRKFLIRRGFWERGDALGDFLGDVVRGGAGAGGAGVGDGLVGGGTVGDDDGAGDAEERRATVDLGVHVVAEALERRHQGEGGQLVEEVAEDDALEPVADGVGGAFGGLEDDVADEAVADDDVGLARCRGR